MGRNSSSTSGIRGSAVTLDVAIRKVSYFSFCPIVDLCFFFSSTAVEQPGQKKTVDLQKTQYLALCVQAPSGFIPLLKLLQSCGVVSVPIVMSQGFFAHNLLIVILTKTQSSKTLIE